MSKKNALQRLLNPSSIAVVGGNAAAEVIRQCRRIGFSGDLMAVNPGRGDLNGIPCVPTVADLPTTPDAAFIAVPPGPAIDVVRELAERGTRGAVCYTSGFAEVNDAGVTLQQRLLEAAQSMAIVGPNCHGIINYLDRVALWPDEHGGMPGNRGAALILQSGNLGISLSMQDRSLPLSYVLTVGNKADLGMHDYIDALLEDPRVTAIGLHVEGLDNVQQFSESAICALKKRVPLVVLKTGTSYLGAEITKSHTNSLSGSDDLYNALFRRLGIIRCESMSQFAETLKLMSVTNPPRGPRIGSISCSGGEASMIADLADKLALEMPPLSAASSDALYRILGDKVHIVNPLDYHTYIWGNREALTGCFTAMLGNGFDCAILVIDYPREGECSLENWEMAEQALIDARDATGCTALIVATLPENIPRQARDRLIEAGIAPMQGLNECLTAIRGAADFARCCDNAANVQPVDVATRSNGQPTSISEWDAKRAVSAHGLTVPEAVLCGPHDAVDSAEILGYPLVAKIVSPDIAHKTEIGGVILDLQNPQQVAEAANRLGRIGNDLMLERMAPPAVAEMIVGVQRDPQFGLALVIGAGGTLAELLDDAVSLLLPVSREDLSEAIDSLKISKIINGFRGSPGGDRDALMEAIMAVVQYAEANRQSLVELDINPLLVLEDGAIAVDAFISRVP